MKNNTEASQDQTPKTPKASKTRRQPAKIAKEAKVESETEPVGRLPASLEELKASKGGLVPVRQGEGGRRQRAQDS